MFDSGPQGMLLRARKGVATGRRRSATGRRAAVLVWACAEGGCGPQGLDYGPAGEVQECLRAAGDLLRARSSCAVIPFFVLISWKSSVLAPLSSEYSITCITNITRAVT